MAPAAAPFSWLVLQACTQDSRVRSRLSAAGCLLRLGADYRARTRVVQEVDRAALVDVANEVFVQAEADQLAQPGGEAAGDCDGNAELLVLLLAHPAGAVVHGQTEPGSTREVRPAAVPQAAVED